jgi:ribosomal protein S9
MADVQHFYGTGRRKTSVARVYLRPGQGQITVNKRTFLDYFPRESLRLQVVQPLELTGTAAQLDVKANVAGAVSPARPAPSGTGSPGPSWSSTRSSGRSSRGRGS